MVLRMMKTSRRLHVRKAARNDQLFCAMTTLGHCTKAFTTIRELAKYVNSTYGPHWYKQLKLKSEDGTSTPAPNRKKA